MYINGSTEALVIHIWWKFYFFLHTFLLFIRKNLNVRCASCSMIPCRWNSPELSRRRHWKSFRIHIFDERKKKQFQNLYIRILDHWIHLPLGVFFLNRCFILTQSTQTHTYADVSHIDRIDSTNFRISNFIPLDRKICASCACVETTKQSHSFSFVTEFLVIWIRLSYSMHTQWEFPWCLVGVRRSFCGRIKWVRYNTGDLKCHPKIEIELDLCEIHSPPAA